MGLAAVGACDRAAVDDPLRSRRENQIDLCHLLAELAGRMQWADLEHALAPRLRSTSNAARPVRPMRPM